MSPAHNAQVTISSLCCGPELLTWKTNSLPDTSTRCPSAPHGKAAHVTLQLRGPVLPAAFSPSGPACLWGLIHSMPLYSPHSYHQSASNQAAHFCGMIQVVLSSLCWQDALLRGQAPPLEPQLTLHGSIQNPGPPEAVCDDAPGPHRTGLDCPFSGPLGVLNVETRVPLSAYASAPALPRGFLGFLKRYSLGSCYPTQALGKVCASGTLWYKSSGPT